MQISTGAVIFAAVLVANSCGRTAPGMKTFTERVNEYAQIRDQARAKVGSLPRPLPRRRSRTMNELLWMRSVPRGRALVKETYSWPKLGRAS